MEILLFSLMEKLKPFLIINGMGWGGVVIFLQTVFKPEEDSKFSTQGMLLTAIGLLGTTIIFLFKYVRDSHKESKEAAEKYQETLLKVNKDSFDAWNRITDKQRDQHENDQDETREMLRDSLKVIADNTISNNKAASASEGVIKALDEVKDFMRKQMNK